MGRGNWIPYNPNERESIYMYVDLTAGREAELEDEDYDILDMDWEDLKYNIKEILPDSFEEAWAAVQREFTYARETVPLFANELAVVTVDGQGEYHHIGIGMTARVDAPAYADHYVAVQGSKFFEKLAEYYNLYVRTGAWTSRPYKPAKR